MKGKKVFSLMLVFAIIFSGMVLPATGVRADEAYDARVTDFLQRLDITPAQATEAVTRYDFAVMVMQSVNAYRNNTAVGDSAFRDVEGIAVSVINPAVELGYFKVPDDRMFRPYDAVTYAEAAAVAVRVLEYEYQIKDTADVGKYLNIAQSQGVLKGVSAQPFTGKEVNRLIYNMLHAKCATTDYYFQSGTHSNDKIVLMEKIFGIVSYSGTVSAINGLAATGSESTNRKYVVIDGKAYKTEDEYSSADFLGSYVNYYVTEDDGEDVLFAMYHRYDIGRIVIEGDDLKSVTDDLSSLTYSANQVNKTVKLASDATILYNHSEKFSASKKDFLQEDATITLVDGDNDNVYDTVSIENPAYYQAAAVSETENRIDDKDGKEPIILSNAHDSNQVSICFEDRTPANFSSISADSRLEVLYSTAEDGTIDYSKAIEITILQKKAEGAIQSISTADKTVRIDGTDYEYVSGIASKLKVGRNMLVYFNTKGKLAFAQSVSGSEKLYGYLVRAYEKEPFSAEVAFKIFTQDGEMKNFEASSKLTYSGYIDGNYVKDKSIEAIDLLKYASDGQLVKFKADDQGILKNIEFAYDHSSDNNYEGYDDDAFSLEYQSNRGKLFNLVASPNYFYDNDSIIFGIPDSGKDSDYVAERYSYFTETNNIPVKVYDTNEKMIAAVGVATLSDSVMQELTDEEAGDEYIALISDKFEMYDEKEDEIVSAFKAYSKGKEVTLVANNEELCDKNIDVPNQGEKSKIYFNELNPGDIIQYRTNQNGQVSLLNVLSRFDKDKMDAKYFVSNPSEDYLSYMILECGKVTKYKAGGYFTLENDPSRKYSLSDKRMPIYLYLYNLSTGTVEVLPSMSYLREATEANPDYVFVKTRRTSVRDVVIYRQ